ncbi:MAG: efflux RND transporter periplasmic adaptor subunit [Vicinamibacterales bacterium]
MKMHALALGLMVSVLAAACGGNTTAGRTAPESAEPVPAELAGAPTDDHDDDAAKDHVEVAPDVQRRLGIGVTAVTAESLAVSLRVTGSVQPIESRLAHVRPLARGRILDVLAQVGDHVTRGQALARFDNIEAGELAAQREGARADLARLRVQLGTATRQAERARRLAEIGAVPQREYEASLGEQQQIEASMLAQESAIAGLEQRLRRFGTSEAAADASSVATILSPLAGVLVRADVAPGDVVDGSTELFAVADISRVYVQAHVFEKDLGKVRQGQAATVTVDAYPDQRFPGTVAVVGGTVDPRTRTVPVRVEVANADARLKLDMFARVDLATDATQPGLAVRREAVQTLEGRQVVFVKSGDTDFMVREVDTGRLSGPLVEITRGLTAGEVVVTAGAFKLKSALLAGTLGDDDDDEPKEPQR